MRLQHPFHPKSLYSAIAFLFFLALPCASFGYGNLQFKDVNDNTVNSLWDRRSYDSDAFPDGIPWLLNDWDPNSVIDVNLAEFQAIVDAAFETWEAVPEANIAFTYAGLTSNGASGNPSDPHAQGLPPHPALDGNNVIVFDDTPYNALAITYIFTLSDEFTFDNNDADPNNDTDFIPEGTYPPGTILDADIVLNTNESEWSVTGERRKYDVQGVLVHEIGHFVGLCHSCVRETFQSRATMFPFVAPNPEGLEQRTLAQDDIAGISSYYPSASFDANFGSISGTVRKGGFPHLGAHIWAVTNDDRSVVVGVLSDESGAYCLQGLPPGDYILRVEPICVQKERVNEILATKEHGQLVNFMAQIYNDVNSEDSATLIAVSAPGYVSPIDFALVNSSEDVFEDDDSRAEARLLVPSGNRELHNFYPKGESDWYRFDVVEAATYRILISNIGVEFEDPFMTLLDESGSTAVNKNDDLFTAGAYYGPCILFTAEETGTYFVDVRGSRWGTEGYARQYDISLTELDPCHAYVDANNGSDEFGDGTREHPWATIQYAIDSVNGTLNKPQFIHVAEGTYYENIVCDPFEWLYGGYEPVTWERDTSSHTATINGMGIASVIRTANMTEIDGFLITGGSSTNGGGISCQPGTVVNIVGNSIFDNHASGNGGGIFLDDYSGGFIERNSITGNTAAEGAGLYSRWGRRGLTISDGVFRDNHASGLGGGAHFGWGPYDDLDILRNRFLGNSGSAGGAIGLRVDLLDTEIRDNLFVQNCASGLGSGYRGGAIYFSEHSRAYILNNLFCQNGSSGMDGGALGLMGVGGSITGNIFVGNSGRLGGVLYYYIASPLITNNIMAGNEARVSGGAICFSSLVRSHIANNTIVQNKAGTFGGAFAFAALSNNEPYIVNNTIAYNSPDSVYENTDDSDPDFLYNNLPTTSTVLYYDHDTATYYYTANEINEDVNNPGKTVANNVGWDPGFKPAPGGMADTIIYDSNTYQSVLTDSNASFEPNALATLTINPDINQPLHFYIISNTQTSVRTWGDMNSVAMPPCTYQVFDYHLAKDSNNIDAGMDVSEYVNTDIDGDPRPLDDGFDIGADEVSLLDNTCWDPAECAGQTSGDATCDGNINLADLFALKAHFGKSAPWTPPECCADFTQDGSINLADLFALKAGFGTSGYSPSTGNQDCPP